MNEFYYISENEIVTASSLLDTIVLEDVIKDNILRKVLLPFK